MSTLVELAGQLVATHAANTPMTIDEILAELGKVHTQLKSLESGDPAPGETRLPVLTLKEAFKKNEVV